MLALLLAGCSTASYPSLARRAAETAPAAEQAPQPQPTASAHPAALDLWLGKAREAQAAFDKALPRTQALLAQAGPRGGEAWSLANLALADLERQRAALGEVIAEMEQTYVQSRIDQLTSPSQTWRETRSLILQIAQDQDRQLAACRAKLRA